MAADEVVWMDATDHEDIKLKEIMNNPTSKYFTKRTTYGKILKEDEHGIVIMTDKDEDDECQITAIPKQMVIQEEE